MFLWHKYAVSAQTQNKVALRNQQGEVFTWKVFSQLVDNVAYYLNNHGVIESSGIAFYSKNSMEVVLLYLASIQLGARVIGINPAFPIEKMQALCKENDIQFYYSQDISIDIHHLIPLKLCIDSYLSDKELPLSIFPIKSDRPVTMTLTSGTTGNPKAIVHSMQCHLENALGVCKLVNFTSNDSWLLSLPLYHVSGQGIIWRWLSTAGELHLPKDDFYSSILKVTHCSLVPTQLQRLLDYITKHNITEFNTKHILLGGTYIPTELTAKLLALGVCSYSGYGMTEMASTVSAKKSDHLSGVGNLLTGRQIKFVNNEIWLRGAGLALGYWKSGKVVSLLNKEGWFATKDRGIWQNGELVILGRMDNMFISGGENIYPEEIEQVILKYPDIEQAFVFPISDKEFGNRPVAMVKLKNGFNQKCIDDLQYWLMDKLEKFKRPIQYVDLDRVQYQNSNQLKISRVLLQKELALLLRNVK